MSRKATLSVLGLYDWDNTLFDLMQIPAALNKDTLIKNLLAETAELEVLYANPSVFKNLIGVWSYKQLDIWNRLYQTTRYEYDPIENYNRYEEGTNNGTGSTTHSGTDTTTDTTTHSGTDTVDMTRRAGGEDIINTSSGSGHWVAGYDSTPSGTEDDGLVKQSRDQDQSDSTASYGKTETNQDKSTYGHRIERTAGTTHGEKVTTENDGGHTLHAHGNIGVTTTQQMIEQQREIEKFNLYDIIIEDFTRRFCILVY